MECSLSTAKQRVRRGLDQLSEQIRQLPDWTELLPSESHHAMTPRSGPSHSAAGEE